MSDKERKPRKVRRRRTTGRVSGTSQSDFAANSMSSLLQKQADKRAGKKADSEDEASDGSQEENDQPDP